MYNREIGGKEHFFVSFPLTRHPHRPKRGVVLCHKSLGSLNHTPDTLLPFLITLVFLHLYSIRDLNGAGYSTQADIPLSLDITIWGDVTVWGRYDGEGCAGGPHLVWTYGDKAHIGGF